jgi:hypothetical protein
MSLTLKTERDHEGMNTELVRAINERRLIEFVYKGGRPRIAEPHDYGILGGVESLLAYQVSGESRSGTPHSWKHIKIEDMSQLRVLDRKFSGSRGDSRQHHLKWDKLFARVK